MWNTISNIILNTNFTVADCIVWKKKSALPNNTSKNKLTRICEYIFVLCRKLEFESFNTNKQITTIGLNGQNYYDTMSNFIEAKNNDEKCSLNKATYSSELVSKLIQMYSTSEDDIILDPFMGTGTTAVGCLLNNRHYIGFELSKAQCEYAQNRIDNILLNTPERKNSNKFSTLW